MVTLAHEYFVIKLTVDNLYFVSFTKTEKGTDSWVSRTRSGYFCRNHICCLLWFSDQASKVLNMTISL